MRYLTAADIRPIIIVKRYNNYYSHIQKLSYYASKKWRNKKVLIVCLWHKSRPITPVLNELFIDQKHRTEIYNKKWNKLNHDKIQIIAADSDSSTFRFYKCFFSSSALTQFIYPTISTLQLSYQLLNFVVSWTQRLRREAVKLF